MSSRLRTQVDNVKLRMHIAGMASTRDLIIRAAAQLLDQGGPDAVTMRAIAGKISMSHNASYSHFRDKTAVLAAVAAREFKKRETEWAQVAQGNRSFRDGIDSYIEWARRFPERFHLTYGRWDEVSEELQEASTATYQTYLRAVDRAQKDGILPEGKTSRLAYLVLAFGNGIANLKLAGHFDQKGRENRIEDLVDDFMAYLKTANGR
jgi:AcrR family transcriptional regulator